MYMRPQDTQLGFVQALTGAAGTALNIAQSFGLGRKKGQIQAIPRGTFLQYFPPGVNWNEVLSRSMNHPRLGRKTYREIFQWMLGRNDSWLIKNNVNNPDDYAAFIIYDQLSKGYGCNPNTRNKNSQSYKDCPKYLDNGINIFDVEALEQHALDKEFEARERQIKQQAQVQQRLEKEQQLVQSLQQEARPQMDPFLEILRKLMPRNLNGWQKFVNQGNYDMIILFANQQKNPEYIAALDWALQTPAYPHHEQLKAAAIKAGYIPDPAAQAQAAAPEPVKTTTTPQPAPPQDRQPAAQAPTPTGGGVFQPTSFLPNQGASQTPAAPAQATGGFMDNLPPWAIPAGIGALALVFLMGGRRR